LKIQVKNGRYKNGCVIGKIERSRNSYNEKEDKSGAYHEDDVDLFALYCSETDKVYGIKYDEAPKRAIHFRVEELKTNTENIRWAESYEIEKIL